MVNKIVFNIILISCILAVSCNRNQNLITSEIKNSNSNFEKEQKTRIIIKYAKLKALREYLHDHFGYACLTSDTLEKRLDYLHKLSNIIQFKNIEKINVLNPYLKTDIDIYSTTPPLIDNINSLLEVGKGYYTIGIDSNLSIYDFNEFSFDNFNDMIKQKTKIPNNVTKKYIYELAKLYVCLVYTKANPYNDSSKSIPDSIDIERLIKETRNGYHFKGATDFYTWPISIYFDKKGMIQNEEPFELNLD